MTNCHIDGVYGGYISLSVGPGKDYLVQIVKDEENKNFEAKISKLFYKIFERWHG